MEAWNGAALEPFRALRYAADDLTPLVAPPYDVLSDAQVDALQQRSPHNISYVDVPRGGDDRYEKAAELLRGWTAEQVLVRDAEPSFTIYRLRFVDATGTERDIAGVLGGLEVVDDGAAGVLPHERTTPKASTDRLDLTRATRTNLSPVWGLSLASGLTDALASRASSSRASPTRAWSTGSNGSPIGTGSPASRRSSAVTTC